jgi:lysyl-tRNA synthetase class 2
MTVDEAFNDLASVSVNEALKQDRFDEIVALEIEPKLGLKRPVFLYDYPASKGALARAKKTDPTKAERFELYIAGLELCNAFSELTDHKEQRKRFEADRNEQKSIHGIETPMPEKFLEALKRMPEASGNALGVDRLVMILTDADRIDDVIPFTPEEL